jgi:hypothetical protein
MYILKEKVKNKSNTLSNLESGSLDKDILIKKYLKKGLLKHSPSPVKEWCNSIYVLRKNSFVKTLLLKDTLIYKVFDIYFNLYKLKNYDNLSMGKIFVGRPEVKHFNNKIGITLYIFDK